MGPHRRWTDVLLLTNIGMFALQTIDPSITSKFAKVWVQDAVGSCTWESSKHIVVCSHHEHYLQCDR